VNKECPIPRHLGGVTGKRTVRSQKQIVCNTDNKIKDVNLMQEAENFDHHQIKNDVSEFQQATPLSIRTRIYSLSAQLRDSCNLILQV
jgi:uncharacterized UPF0160 family protein